MTNCATMLKDWEAGGNCASWPRKKGGKRAATKIPSIGLLLLVALIIALIVGQDYYHSESLSRLVWCLRAKIIFKELKEPPIIGMCNVL